MTYLCVNDTCYTYIKFSEINLKLIALTSHYLSLSVQMYSMKKILHQTNPMDEYDVFFLLHLITKKIYLLVYMHIIMNINFITQII